ncbi:phosphoribosyltransferase family protein [Catellatospora methionotrophica]|uniref:phosphoribosyltransferase family protein n=1 Tax=Catellatospora methionotrophica TaxID=121620 RepID=UPI0033F5DF01
MRRVRESPSRRPQSVLERMPDEFTRAGSHAPAAPGADTGGVPRQAGRTEADLDGTGTPAVWAGDWVADRLGVVVTMNTSATEQAVEQAGSGGVAQTSRYDKVMLSDLAGLAVRRNTRRAHLVVSTVLGKNIPVTPRRASEAGHRLGELVAQAIGASPVLVIGYAETATSLGHLVADALPDADYLHSTRRLLPGETPVGTFTEAHSHATEHLLVPAEPELLATERPVVLVDDELTTGRTALATIGVLQAIRHRPRYIIATLLDLRSDADRAAFAADAARLGTRIDVVALAQGVLSTPDDVLERGRQLVAEFSEPSGQARTADRTERAASVRATVRRVTPQWPAGLPVGGRRGIPAARRGELDDAVMQVAATVADQLPANGRILVLGTEELMYTPLRVACAIAQQRSEHPADEILFSSTTRSPALAIDDPSYAIRTSLAFPAHDLRAVVARDTAGHRDAPERFAYNVAPSAREPGFAAIVLVIDGPGDTDALWDPSGLVEALRGVCDELIVVRLP